MEDTDTVYCYLVRKNTHTWYLARSDCLNSDSDLLSITSDKEQEFVTKHLLAESFMWIGFNDLKNEGKWAWSDRYCHVPLEAINSYFSLLDASPFPKSTRLLKNSTILPAIGQIELRSDHCTLFKIIELAFMLLENNLSRNSCLFEIFVSSVSVACL